MKSRTKTKHEELMSRKLNIKKPDYLELPDKMDDDVIYGKHLGYF